MQKSVHLSDELTSQTPAQIIKTTLYVNQTSLQNNHQLPWWQLQPRHHQYIWCFLSPAIIVNSCRLGWLLGCLVWVNLRSVWSGGLTFDLPGGWVALWVVWWVNLLAVGKWVAFRVVSWVGWLAVYRVWGLTCTLSGVWFMSGLICRQSGGLVGEHKYSLVGELTCTLPGGWVALWMVQWVN